MAKRAAKTSKKPRGRVRGIPVPSTAKSALASRTNAWKHGHSARVVSEVDVRRAQLEKHCQDGPAIVDAYVDAIEHGELEGQNRLAVTAMAETELIRRDLGDSIRKHGVLVDEAVLGPDGKVLPNVVRRKANPALEHYNETSRALGFTADQLLIARKSRGEGIKDAAITARIARDAKLRGMDKSRMPGPAIPATIVR